MKAIFGRPPSRPREGWDEKFGLMAEHGNDRVIDEDLSGQTEWDQNEWEW